MHSRARAGALLWCLIVTTPWILTACGSATREDTPGQVDEIVFPPPPAEARFVYERSLFSSAGIKADTSGDRFRRFVTGERITGRGFGKPFDVTACQGRIYVSDTVERAIMVFDVPGQRFFEFGNDEPGLLAQPLGIGADGQCNVYVADGTSQRVMIYDKDGNFQAAIGGPDWFNRLSHAAPSSDGTRLFAVDTGGVGSQEHRIRVFDVATGNHLRDIGTRGAKEGQFNLPRDLEIGRDGLLYVVDGANFRVQVLDQNGRFVRMFGDVGRQSGQFSRPKGIAVDTQGRVYVSDAAFGNFQIFQPDGKLLLWVGQRGTRAEPATYMLPAGIDVDEDGRVLMVDQFFRKVDIFRPVSLAKDAGYLGRWAQVAEAQ